LRVWQPTYANAHMRACMKQRTHLVRISLMLAFVLRHFCTRSSTLASRAEPSRVLPRSAPAPPLGFLEGDALPDESAESDLAAESESDREFSIGVRMQAAASCST